MQISVSSEVAAQIVSSVENLHHPQLPSQAECVMELLEKAQRQVFAEMVPYWGSFCKVYESPVESLVSLPQGDS